MAEHNKECDLVILGSGSAAFAAAIKASELGAKVAMTESRQIGGTCVNRGCIPSKNLIRAAEIYDYGRFQPFEGLKLRQGGVDFAQLVDQKDELVLRLRKKKYLDIAEGTERIDVLQGTARFVGKNRIQVGDDLVEAPRFLIATGASIRIPEIEGLDRLPYLTSDLLTSQEAMELKELPRSLMIIGGGFIALELGQMFHRLGSQVTILQRGPRLISNFDEEVAASIQKILEREGIKIVLNARAKKVRQVERGVSLTASLDGGESEFQAERLLLATGVVPNTRHLSLEIPGVELDPRGFVKVDDEMRTSTPHVWAAGDVTGPPLATPVGAREGVVAAENIVNESSHKKMDYWAIPRAIFTDPEVASVGLTIEAAKEKGFKVRANCLFLDHVPKAAAIRDTRGLVKMVIDADTRRVLGVHLVAHRGADIIHEATLAVKFKLTIDDLIDTIHIYPTMSEAIRMAAQTFTKDVSKLSCCAE